MQNKKKNNVNSSGKPSMNKVQPQNQREMGRAKRTKEEMPSKTSPQGLPTLGAPSTPKDLKKLNLTEYEPWINVYLTNDIY